MFLSTSETRGVAEGMMRDRGGPDFVIWVINLDASRQCDHMNYVNKNDGTLNVSPHTAAEDEFLFAPYSVFTVMRVGWLNALVVNDMHHEIELKVEPGQGARAPR